MITTCISQLVHHTESRPSRSSFYTLLHDHLSCYARLFLMPTIRNSSPVMFQLTANTNDLPVYEYSTAQSTADMADNKSTTTSSTDTESLKMLVPDNRSFAALVPNTLTASSATTSTPTEKKVKTSWHDILSFSSKPEEPGKEKWCDASLSEKDRWKEWQKAREKEQRNGYVSAVKQSD
jgi:hypothetical protein